MFSEPVISLSRLSKCYRIYEKPRERLLQMLSFGRKAYGREFWALQNVNLDVFAGEVIGVIGRNGSGKSTLLQLVCGTLYQTHGEVSVHGRIAALLELGAGFNHEFSGRENVFLSASVMGISHAEIMDRYESIVEFSGVREFIDQPVKTYSSGMYVRLAFAIAIHVDPDILIIDEALSVGDGAFAHQSFERIMALKDAGKTILFCSHSLYQVEALCNRVLWLEGGAVRQLGEASEVTSAYGQHLDALVDPPPQCANPLSDVADIKAPASALPGNTSAVALIARLTRVELTVNGSEPQSKATINSGQDDVRVQVSFVVNEQIPEPVIGIVFSDEHDRTITSIGSHIDNIRNMVSSTGEGIVEVIFPAFPLLKGNYLLHVYLLCDRGIHVYDSSLAAAHLQVRQVHLEQGVVSIPHRWHCPSRSADLAAR